MYPQTTGYAKGSDTSKAAAETLYNKEGLHYAVLASLYINPHGLVVDDMKRLIEGFMNRTFDRTTIGARVTELKAAGMVQETEERGVSARGKSATVYKLTTKGRDFILNS